MGNAYLDNQRKKEQLIFEAGMDIGYQRCLDYMQIVLRNPKYVGKDIFGRLRWEILYKALKETDDLYGDPILKVWMRTTVKRRSMRIFARSLEKIRCLLRNDIR